MDIQGLLPKIDQRALHRHLQGMRSSHHFDQQLPGKVLGCKGLGLRNSAPTARRRPIIHTGNQFWWWYKIDKSTGDYHQLESLHNYFPISSKVRVTSLASAGPFQCMYHSSVDGPWCGWHFCCCWWWNRFSSIQAMYRNIITMIIYSRVHVWLKKKLRGKIKCSNFCLI